MNLSTDMKISEIEKELSRHGDFIKMDMLTKFQNKVLTGEVKKFVSTRLLEIYVRRGMFQDAAKMADNIAISSSSTEEKREYNMMEIQFYVRAGVLDRASIAIKKVLNELDEREKEIVYARIRLFYRKQAEKYSLSKQRRKASEIYEELLEMNLEEKEKAEVRKKLMELYDSLGKVKEYLKLKNSNALGQNN